jgi:hypothetical protein
MQDKNQNHNDFWTGLVGTSSPPISNCRRHTHIVTWKSLNSVLLSTKYNRGKF